MAIAYKNPLEAEQGLTAAFAPTTVEQQQVIANAAALVPGQNPPPPINRGVDQPPTDPAEKFLSTFTAPQSSAQIAERKRQQSQGLIDEINNTANEETRRLKTIHNERLAIDNATSVLAGLTGSTEAGASRNKVVAANEEELQAVKKKRLTDLQKVYGQINKDADEEARQQLTDATKRAEDIVARREASQSKAIENLKLMASSGLVDYDSFKSSPQNKKVFGYALASVGGSEDALKGLFALNRPKETVLDKKWVGSKLYQVYQNPITGKTRSEVVDLGFDVPPDYTTEVDLGDRIMLLDPKNPDKRLIFNKGLTPKEQADVTATQGDTQKSQATIDLVKSAVSEAKKLSGASGRSGLRRSAESWLLGSTDYSNLVAQTNTIKTNVLTLIGDPTIKKFFGPQMSNADVTLMTSAGTTLNPELQSPEKLTNELVRLEDLLMRMDKAVQQGTSGTDTDRVTVVSPDGTEGTIPKSQLQEALSAGYRQK